MRTNGFLGATCATAILGGALTFLAGCDAESGGDVAASRRPAEAAAKDAGPTSLPPTNDVPMTQVGPDSLPPELAAEPASSRMAFGPTSIAPEPDETARLSAPQSDAPPMLTPQSFDATPSMSFAPAPRMARQGMDAAASPGLAEKVGRFSPPRGTPTYEPSGGSAEPYDPAAYGIAPPSGDAPLAPQSSATARSMAAPEAATMSDAPTDTMTVRSLSPMGSGASTSAAANSAVETRPDGSKWVKIFYATDRSAERVAHADATVASNVEVSPWQQHLPVLFCIGGTILAAGFAFLFAYRKTGVAMLVCGAGIAAAVFGSQGTKLGWFAPPPARAVEFGAGRDALRFGVCQISLPPGHERGTMESPSLLHLEWHPDPAKHVALLETVELDREECLTRLRDDLAASPKSEVFVFIHGYNVTFEDAARRTGQLAHDLEFPGPAMLYSWPSQGTTAGYAIDENNVAWTVPHLKDVLQTLQAETGASAVHVVAHSMGNRALTSAVRELALEGKLSDTPLGQIVLAAPDVDAEIFRRDLLPKMQESAERVTLYASSYDRALLVSKTIHGYPRAGESGEGLVIADGLETIDVSGIDLSLLGHSYYGDVAQVVEDLKTLIFENKAAAARPYLVARDRQGLAYWQVMTQAASRSPVQPR